MREHVTLDDLTRLAEDARQDSETLDHAARRFFSGLVGCVGARYGEDAADRLARAGGFDHLAGSPHAMLRSMAAGTGLVPKTEQRKDPVVELRRAADECDSVAIGCAFQRPDDARTYMGRNADFDHVQAAIGVVAPVVLGENIEAVPPGRADPILAQIADGERGDEVLPPDACVENEESPPGLVRREKGTDDFHGAAPVVITESAAGLGFPNEMKVCQPESEWEPPCLPPGAIVAHDDEIA